MITSPQFISNQVLFADIMQIFRIFKKEEGGENHVFIIEKVKSMFDLEMIKR